MSVEGNITGVGSTFYASSTSTLPPWEEGTDEGLSEDLDTHLPVLMADQSTPCHSMWGKNLEGNEKFSD